MSRIPYNGLNAPPSFDSKIIDGLCEIDWENIDSLGNAKWIPYQLTQLARFNNYDDWSENFQELFFEQMYHQGIIYGATPQIIRIFHKLLLDINESAVVDLLWGIATAGKCTFSDDFNEDLSNSDIGPKYRSILLNTREAIIQGAKTYLNFLKNPDPSIRSHAIYALLVCNNYSSEILTHLENEKDHAVLSTGLTALYYLDPESGYDLAKNNINANSMLGLISSALISLVLKDKTPADVIHVITDSVVKEDLEGFEDLPFDLIDQPYFFATEVLIKVGPPAGYAAIPILSKTLNDCESYQAEEPFQAILGATFSLRQTPLLLSELNEHQYRVLKCIINSEAVWKRGTGYLGPDPLTERGLPNTRDELIKFIN
jgi:hypothetical protein